MSDFGTFVMDRGWFEHPVFQDEPFTEREAWAWMIARASSTDRTRRVGNIAVPVRRGQLAHSGRFLAKRFKWSLSRVQRFLARLVAESMIVTGSVAESVNGSHLGHPINCITICNYDKYQSPIVPPESQSESPAGQTKKESLTRISDSVVGGGDARARESTISPEAFTLADEVMKTLAISTEFIPPGWCGLPMWLDTGLKSGWQPELVRIAAAKLRAKRDYQPPYSFKYLNGPIARVHTEFATPPLPLSPVAIHQPEPTHATPRPSDWRIRRDQQHDAHAEFRAATHAAAERERDEGRGHIVQLVPNARRG